MCCRHCCSHLVVATVTTTTTTTLIIATTMDPSRWPWKDFGSFLFVRSEDRRVTTTLLFFFGVGFMEWEVLLPMMVVVCVVNNDELIYFLLSRECLSWIQPIQSNTKRKLPRFDLISESRMVAVGMRELPCSKFGGEVSHLCPCSTRTEQPTADYSSTY